MLPRYHFLFGLIFSAILFPIVKWNSLIILMASVLIDVDHYLYYVFKVRKFNLKKSFNYFYMGEFGEKKLLFVFHTVEFWVILLIASLYFHILFYFLIGIMFHMFLDLFNIKKKKLSLVHHFVKKHQTSEEN